MNTKANLEAIRGRLEGHPATRFRAAALAGAAGVGVATVIYRSLRGPASE
jgi:hypothetical protein